jgi:hypothetical protein
MFTRLRDFALDMRDRQRISIALGRGAAMMQARHVDLRCPATWEFSGFSQNGEDGILDVLRRQLLRSNRYFIEIGAADGIENNSTWLVVAERYSGIMVEGNPKLAARMKRMIINYSIGAECLDMFVTANNIPALGRVAIHKDPDVLSLDIDGNDFYVAKALLEGGIRPKIFVVEYNSAFGPERSVTIAYKDDFVFTEAHSSHLYYGVSISGWRNWFKEQGYRFVTVERNGINAFFVDAALFDPEFLTKLRPLDFAENQFQRRRFRKTSEEQFKLIADQEFVTI